MRTVIRFITIAVLALLFETTSLGYVQSPQHENQNKQHSQDKKQDQNKRQDLTMQPGTQHRNALRTQQRQQEHNRVQSPQQQQRQQGRNRQETVRQMQRSQEQQREQQPVQQRIWQQRRANNWNSEHRSWQQRGGYTGYRIPDNEFRSHYGRTHWFRIYNLPFMFERGYPRFLYNGYWFVVIDPYPEYWGPNWYLTDDVYVEYYDDGYYLFNRRYPIRHGLAISVTLM
jgi:hypothetical protein